MTDSDQGPSTENTERNVFQISLRGLEECRPEYANYLNVNYDAYAFHIAFSRLVGPIFATEADRQAFENSGWTADVVARLLIPPDALRNMVEFLQKQLEIYDEQYGVADGETASDSA